MTKAGPQVNDLNAGWTGGGPAPLDAGGLLGEGWASLAGEAGVTAAGAGNSRPRQFSIQ